MAAVLNEPSGWRGRQQQITTLQNKVSGLPIFIYLSHDDGQTAWRTYQYLVHSVTASKKNV